MLIVGVTCGSKERAANQQSSYSMEHFSQPAILQLPALQFVYKLSFRDTLVLNALKSAGKQQRLLVHDARLVLLKILFVHYYIEDFSLLKRSKSYCRLPC
ncbi:hypothetical protein NE237_008171 [Protea cynaroides]|uniref:Uncharacterized protein n=1 Tax=Protea cynaroides TaxID=273540 RepID=A0A9Q0QX43_9MAGN|nr:hypothetical protein NE237_008171 [Protea cynaroides]